MPVKQKPSVFALQGGSDKDFIRTQLQLEAREQEMDQLESKMASGAKLLADKDSRLRHLEFSLLDNTAVCVSTYLQLFTAKLIIASCYSALTFSDDSKDCAYKIPGLEICVSSLLASYPQTSGVAGLTCSYCRNIAW